MALNAILVLLGVFLVVHGFSPEDEFIPRAKRGASVYVTFPTTGAIQPKVTKSPQDFINSIGANNNGYSADSAFGGNLASQYQQSSGSGFSSHGGGRSSSTSYGKRRKRSASFEFLNPYFNFESQPRYHLYNQHFENYYPSVEYADEISNPDQFSSSLPNPVIVDGLLEAAANSYNGHAAVFKAFTSKTPYFGLNGSSTQVDFGKKNNNTNKN